MVNKVWVASSMRTTKLYSIKVGRCRIRFTETLHDSGPKSGSRTCLSGRRSTQSLYWWDRGFGAKKKKLYRYIEKQYG